MKNVENSETPVILAGGGIKSNPVQVQMKQLSYIE